MHEGEIGLMAQDEEGPGEGGDPASRDTPRIPAPRDAEDPLDKGVVHVLLRSRQEGEGFDQFTAALHVVLSPQDETGAFLAPRVKGRAPVDTGTLRSWDEGGQGASNVDHPVHLGDFHRVQFGLGGRDAGLCERRFGLVAEEKMKGEVGILMVRKRGSRHISPEFQETPKRIGQGVATKMPHSLSHQLGKGRKGIIRDPKIQQRPCLLRELSSPHL